MRDGEFRESRIPSIKRRCPDLSDGGGGNDPNNHAQSPNALLGKMLRIDVNGPDKRPGGLRVPPDNPFVRGVPIAAPGSIVFFAEDGRGELQAIISSGRIVKPVADRLAPAAPENLMSETSGPDRHARVCGRCAVPHRGRADDLLQRGRVGVDCAQDGGDPLRARARVDPVAAVHAVRRDAPRVGGGPAFATL